jgi:hypothetical protein
MQESEPNRKARIALAKGLVCPCCGRAIQSYDFEWIAGVAFQITCQGCHQTVLKHEGY